MEQAHNESDHVLCVVSKAYLKAPWSSWERRAAQWAAANDRPGFMLPVFVEDCNATTLSAQIKRCDLFGIGEDKARVRLAKFLEPAGKPTERGPFPGGTQSEEASKPAYVRATRPSQPFPPSAQSKARAEWGEPSENLSLIGGLLGALLGAYYDLIYIYPGTDWGMGFVVLPLLFGSFGGLIGLITYGIYRLIYRLTHALLRFFRWTYRVIR